MEAHTRIPPSRSWRHIRPPTSYAANAAYTQRRWILISSSSLLPLPPPPPPHSSASPCFPPQPTPESFFAALRKRYKAPFGDGFDVASFGVDVGRLMLAVPAFLPLFGPLDVAPKERKAAKAPLTAVDKAAQKVLKARREDPFARDPDNDDGEGGKLVNPGRLDAATVAQSEAAQESRNAQRSAEIRACLAHSLFGSARLPGTEHNTTLEGQEIKSHDGTKRRCLHMARALYDPWSYSQTVRAPLETGRRGAIARPSLLLCPQHRRATICQHSPSPISAPRTQVENIFYFSFLVKSGTAGIHHGHPVSGGGGGGDAGGASDEPYIWISEGVGEMPAAAPAKKGSSAFNTGAGGGGGGAPSFLAKQFVFSIDYYSWLGGLETLKMTNKAPVCPHRATKDSTSPPGFKCFMAAEKDDKRHGAAKRKGGAAAAGDEDEEEEDGEGSAGAAAAKGKRARKSPAGKKRGGGSADEEDEEE